MVDEARRLVAGGWCQGASARDDAGLEVPSWSDEARSWSLLGALLSSWHSHDSQGNGEVGAHLADAEALGRATEVLGDVLGTASLKGWNDEPDRTHGEVVGAFEQALVLLDEN
jgi:hypothetical protein